MYGGLLLILAGEAVVWQAVALGVYTLLVATGFHLRVVMYEEPGLHNQFGADFDRYCVRVPRWWPRFNALPDAPA